MKSCWLNRTNNRDCILFMAGWGMGPEPFKSMVPEEVAVLMIYDYRNIDQLDIRALLPDTPRLHLLAWSMGVWAAGRLLTEIRFSSATAVGGTCRPIDDKLGIPEQVFDETIDNFSPAVLANFYSAMFDSPGQARRFLDTPPDRPLQELKEELMNLRSACRMQPEVKDIFNSRLVTSRDRIFPARNQIRAWGRDNCKSIPLPHFPFYQQPDWLELSGQAGT
jgi:biotin synthesis protein BioG